MPLHKTTNITQFCFHLETTKKEEKNDNGRMINICNSKEKMRIKTTFLNCFPEKITFSLAQLYIVSNVIYKNTFLQPSSLLFFFF